MPSSLSLSSPFDLRGKTALVFGASRPIGKAIAVALAEAGARLCVTWFDWPEDSARMMEEFDQRGYDYISVRADLREPDQVATVFARLVSEYGGLDVFINNIERGGMPVVHGPYTPQQWDLEMATTLKAKWWAARHAMPLLKAAPEGGVMVVLSSIAGVIGRSGPAGLVFNDGYAAANRAVASFVETWAREGAPSVRVNELMLGIFEHRHGEGTRGWGLLAEEERRAILGTALLGRSGKTAEVARAVLFLVRDATYMTGALLRLDGGYVLGASRVPPMPPGEEDV